MISPKIWNGAGPYIKRAPGAVAQGAVERLPQRYRHIFNGVMFVDMQIASRGDFKIKQAMMGNMMQHMVIKPHPSLNIGQTTAV
jgi:hypothetical protein